ncbi:sulfite exporter TauE/SafE family protein [Planctobacterium marinum]|uniref:Probable membrane transporter protein n=1 Tax=Planctobacterium marinum TaxID=1631968 RepID=A0AA48HQC6_9ALTE|nr:hypothetical protein MACH26_15800 [Planctobacterium marinum]
MHYSKATLIRCFLFALWCLAFFAYAESPLQLLGEYIGFAFLGIVGAIFANSTGAGGGVIFVPFFSQLGLDNTTIVATSFAIQCFGMTAGALSWFLWFKKEKKSDVEWQPLYRVLLLTVPFSIAGIWWVQIVDWQSPNSLHATFGAFSVVLALAIFASIPLLKNSQFSRYLTGLDNCFLPVIALLGGGITAWLSVGVGELIAIYLIFRRFNVSFAIASAVILSAFSVWAGVLYHIMQSGAVYWAIVLFAGLGAVIGGSIARFVVLYFSVTRLKLFFAGWVLLIGIASLPL